MRLLVSCLAFALAALVAPAPSVAQQAQDWSRTVTATAEGGFRMGNPDAPVKLVEYGSLTCPTCALFAKEGVPPLVANYVRSGKVSFEFRSYVLNGVDVVATLLARCAGPSRFFAVAERLYATQPHWSAKLFGLTDQQKNGLKSLPNETRMARMADLGGLTHIAAQAGLPAAEGKKCLAQPDALAGLERMKQAASRQGVTGTPTFIVNGYRNYAHEWAELEPLLRQPGS